MAAGDIALNAPIQRVVIPGFSLTGFSVDIKVGRMVIAFEEQNTGTPHQVIVTDQSCTGFDVSGLDILDNQVRAINTEYSKLLSIIFGATTGGPAARRKALVEVLIGDGIIGLAGTVG